MIKNLLLMTIIFGGCFFLVYPIPVLATDQDINFSVKVLQHKSTDTINDFVWNGVINEPKVPLKNVLGVSTVNQDLVNNSKLTTQHLSYLFLLISPIYSLYYLRTVIN